MPRLVVVRGEALVCQVELDRLPVTIGRAAANDVVLDDPLKSVSREHAHVRQDGQRFVLVDQQSENGIWLAGQRLPVIPFTADTTASIGPFRLRIEGLPPEPRRTPVPPAAAAPPPPPHPAGTTRFPQQVRLAMARVTPRQWQIAGGAVATFVLAVVGVWLGLVQPARERARIEALSAGALATAQGQISRGLCADALGQTIQPALERDPGHVGLRDVKLEAEKCLAAPPPAPTPPVDPYATEVLWVRGQLTLRICDGDVVPRTEALLQRAPDNPEYQALKAELDSCRSIIKPTAPAAPKLALKIPPEQGGLEPLDKELDRDYQVRVNGMRERYVTALAAAKASVSRESVQALEALAADLPAGYLDVDVALRAARTALRAATEALVIEGRALAGQKRWNDAEAKLREARALDPELRIDADQKRIQEGKIAQGEELCRTARQQANYETSAGDAQRLFRQVMELLPPEHPCYAAALKVVNRK